MLNHTYTSVKNANLVDCGKKQHVASQPSPLLKDNFLGEFRTELDKKKVLANLGIATKLSLVWENITGDIGANELLIKALDSRTKYISLIEQFKGDTISIIDGIRYLETVVGGEQEGEDEQNERLKLLEEQFKLLADALDLINELLKDPIKIDIDLLKQNLEEVSKQIANINDLIQISGKAHNALVLIPENSEQLAENETPGLYVPDLEPRVAASEKRFEPIETNVQKLQTDVETVKKEYVSKAELGGDGDFKFVKEQDFTSYVNSTSTTLGNIQTELVDTIKKGEDGHVKDLSVHLLSKYTDEDNIKITDSFEVTSGIPLDVRFVKETLEELYKIPAKVCYPGMGVIVNETCALYILREPLNEGVITSDYVANPKNWKCPEDLVTKALSRDEYENLKTIDEHIFYYIYEDPITQTQEPIREPDESDENWEKRWNEWVKSLKTLSQEYMSAAWGVDIENKLGKKASSLHVSILQAEINNIKGNGNNPSLESLNKSVLDLKVQDNSLQQRLDLILLLYEDIELGRLVDLEKNVSTVKDSLSNYITKDYIQDPENDFIFVKEDDYNSDKEEFQQQLSEQVSTKEVITNVVSLSGKKLEGTDKRLQYNAVEVANLNDIPEIKILSQEDYDNLPESDIKDDIYYYTFDGDNIYVTKKELDRTSARLLQQINALFQGGTAEDIESTLEVIFLPIETWTKFQQEYAEMSNLVTDLNNRLLKLEPLKFVNNVDNTQVSGDPERCYISEDTIYIQSDLITVI